MSSGVGRLNWFSVNVVACVGTLAQGVQEQTWDSVIDCLDEVETKMLIGRAQKLY